MALFGGDIARLQDYYDLMEIGLSQVLVQELKNHEELYPAWLATTNAKEWVEDELVMSGFGAMPQKTVGGGISTDKPQIGTKKDFTLVPYALGFVAEYELLRWDQYARFKNITKQLAIAGKDRKNLLAYAIPNNAFSTANPIYTTHRSEALCSNSHALLRGIGTGKNAPSTAIDLTYLGLQEARTDFRKTVDEDGRYTILMACCLMVAPEKEWVAETLVGSDYRPDNANMALNTVKGKMKVHSAPYLTSANAWFVLASKDRLKPNMSFVVGDDLEFRKAFDPSTLNAIFSMYASFRIRVLTWPGFWGSQGT